MIALRIRYTKIAQRVTGEMVGDTPILITFTRGTGGQLSTPEKGIEHCHKIFENSNTYFKLNKGPVHFSAKNF